VRGAEKLVSEHFIQTGALKPTRGPASSSGPARLAPAVQHLQNRLQQHLATHVSLHHSDKKGRIEIEYYGNDDLQRILDLLGIKSEES
jgi:ParB family chromosome partitioning protein